MKSTAAKIAALRQKTVLNGCTPAEEDLGRPKQFFTVAVRDLVK